MGRNLEIAKATVKGTAKDIGRAASDIAADTISSSHAEPSAPTVGKDYATRTAAEHNDMSTVKSLVGAKSDKKIPSYKTGTSYVPKTGPAMLHKGEAVIPEEKNYMDAKDAMAKISPTAKPPKKIHKIVTHKTDDGKLIHTHLHHHPAHHPDETHVSNNMEEAQDHMAAMEPNMSAQPPEMPGAGAPAGAAPPPAGM